MTDELELLPPLSPEELDEEIIHAIDFTTEWYRSIVHPATLSLRNAAIICGRSISLVHSIAYAPIKMVSDQDVASTDGEVVMIPMSYFYSKFYERLRIPVEFIPLSSMILFNGSTSHEAMHIQQTECDIIEACEKFGKPEHIALSESNMFFIYCIQLIEDLFIENYGRFFYPKHSEFVNGKNAIFFQRWMMEESFEKLESKQDTMGFLYYRKNIALDDRFEWYAFDPYVQVMDKARDLSLSKSDRLDIAYELFQLLHQDDSKSGEAEMPIPGESGMVVIFIDSEEATSADPSQPSVSGTKDPSKKTEITAVEARELRELVGMIIKEISDEELKIAPKSDEYGTQKVVKYYDALDVDEHHNWLGELNPSREWFRFAQFFRYFLEEKHVPGRAKDTGSRILPHRLHHILTDNKFLADRDGRAMKKGIPEQIFLVDLSGSMASMHGSDRSLAAQVLVAAYGIFMSLASARMPVAIYGHTSLTVHGSLETPIVVGIAAYNMPLGASRRVSYTFTQERFMKVGKIQLCENYDGYAIDFVSNLFTTRPGDKIVSVLSDGAPSAPDYRGSNAVDHTKAMVKKTRKKGHHVISYSLVPSVVSVNNAIYGQDHNVQAYGARFDRVIQEAVMRITRASKLHQE